MDWQEEYKKRLCSAEDAVKLVKSGDRVLVPLMKQPMLLPEALVARKDEVRNVEVLMTSTSGLPPRGWKNLSRRLWSYFLV